MARRQALALTLVSFFAWSTWELVRPARNPFMDLSGVFTDQFSHMNAARVFMRHGSDVWRVPLQRLESRPSREQFDALPDELKRRPETLFVVPGWHKPISQSWASVVRFYPPGDMLLTAPVAALYHFTSLSFADANRLLLVLFLCAAHAGLFVLLEGLLGQPEPARFSGALAGYLAVNCTLRWTLEGFYDACIFLPLLLSWRYLGQRRGLAAVVAFCAAAFLHFRAFYYGPWALAGAWLFVRDRQWRGFARKDFLALAAAAVMGAASLYSFALSLPGLLQFEQQSALVITANHFDKPALLLAAGVAALAMAAFASARSWFDVAQVCWFALVLTNVRQSYAWYSLALIPWLVAPPRLAEPRKAGLVFDARIAVFLFLALYVHADGSHAVEAAVPTWIPRLLR